MSEVATYSSATSLVPHNMNEAIRLAEFMASARTVPKHLWDSPGDCLMVVELAMRWGMSPFAVAQATSVISGKQMIEGKLVAAAVENSGAIVGHIDYQFSGEGEGRSITVTATRRGETNPREVTVKLADAKTANQMWTKQPDQQLVYHGARVWARRWTPAVILGVYSREEIGPIIEGEAVEEPADERERLNREVPLRAAAAPMPRAPRVTERTPDDWGALRNQGRAEAPPPASTPRRTIGQLLDGIKFALRDATSRREADRILDSEDVLKLRESFAADSPAIMRLDAMRDEALERFPPMTDEDEVLDELPEIKGEANVLAG